MLRKPVENEWFPSGLAQCCECGARFNFSPPEALEEVDPQKPMEAARWYGQDGGDAVSYRPVRCPRCRSKEVPINHTAGRVRYHKCDDCGKTFKSVEK